MGHHKDGLTASCPHFQERQDYKAGHWIRCRMGSKCFGDTWERNQYYKAICCEGGRGCELIDIKKARGPKE
jgi:hypothetical protein